MKIYINGFRGPWSWLPEFETYLLHTMSEHSIRRATHMYDADVIFQVDKDTNYNETAEYFGKKIIIGNMLDFAEWARPLEKNIPLQNYLNFISKCTVITGISNKVIEQTKAYFPNKEYKKFFYPSQVSKMDHSAGPKEKFFVSFCRLGDKGKRIRLAVTAFEESGLSNKGYLYYLIGPQPPSFVLPQGVTYLGYVEKKSLFSLVTNATATLMPSAGEGLGLPAIESSLLGTIPIMTKIRPMTDVFDHEFPHQFFTTKEELIDSLKWAAEIEGNDISYGVVNQALAKPWLREDAYKSLIELLQGCYDDYK